MSLLAAVRVVLHDKTCFIASLCPSLYGETLQCCYTVANFLTQNGLQIEENPRIDFLGQVKLSCVWECFVPLCVHFVCLYICV